MTNKTKTKIILGVMLISGLVFAAYTTKFYGDIDMQSHKITNVATPTVNADATTKAYVDSQIHTRLNKQGGQLTGTLDMQTNYIIRVHGPRSGAAGNLDAVNKFYVNNTFLPLTGGDLSGRLNLGGNKIINLAKPTDPTDGASKAYVDEVAQQAGFQSFVLRKGSGYTPLYNLDNNSNRYFNVVVVKQFNGSVTSYFESGLADCSTNFPAKTYKVGDVIKIPFRAKANNFSQTNGTLVVSSDGAVGNFGVTFPPTLVVVPFKVYIGNRSYNQNTSGMIQSEITSDVFDVGITNLSNVAITDVQAAFAKVQYYETSTEYNTDVQPEGGVSTICPTIVNVASIPAKGCAWFHVMIIGYDDANIGMKWNFEFMSGGTTYRFGQFFVPPVDN